MPWKLASSSLLLGAVILSGCSANKPAEDAVHNDQQGRCNATAAEYAVGKKASQELLEQARVRSGAQIARILSPGDIVTLEYRSDRLNLNVDGSSMVIRANCG